MKKKVAIIVSLLAFVMIISGCTVQKKEFNKNEEEIINLANSEIEKTYNIKIDRSLFDYSLGKKVGENIFQTMAENETPEIISVCARRFNEGKVGEISGYTLIYNTKTKKTVNSIIEKF